MLPKKFGAVFVLLLFAVLRSSSGDRRIKHPIKKIIIDTDGVADDVIAIIMALEAERLEGGPKVIAITCLNGVSYLDDCIMNVLKTLKALNRIDIPVYAGAARPLLRQNEKDHSYGIDGFGDFEYPDPPSRDLVQKTHAVNAIIDLVKKYPGEITIFTMAPTTNVALAISMYPELVEKVQQLIIMGGSFEGQGNVRPGIDFNSFVDPAGNHIAFSSVKSVPIVLVYLEATRRARLPMEFRVSLNEINNTKSWLIRNGERTALSPREKYWYCPDAVAVAVAITSGGIVTRSELTRVDAIYEGTKTRGMTVADWTNVTGRTPNAILVQDIDRAEFQLLVDRLVRS